MTPTIDLHQHSRGLSNDLEPVNKCIHDAIAEQARETPSATAVTAYDDAFTFAELDHISTKLAHHLVDLGVGAETIVPICFERSAWAVVAMLAVLKSGAAYAPLSTDDPHERLGLILDTLSASPVVLVSAQQLSRLQSITNRHVQLVSRSAVDELPDTPGAHLPATSPAQLSYCLFTSGSTGRPKGVLIEHRAFMSALADLGATLRMGPRTRFFNFTKLTADVSCLEILGTLALGGCACVPAEQDIYGDVFASLRSMRVTHLACPPTYLKLLSPERAKTAPALECVIVASELIHGDVIAAWAPHVRFHASYGPTETFYCSVTPPLSAEDNVTGLVGEPFACRFWLADPEDPGSPAVEGHAAELMVEGPLLARGYLNDEEKTRASFIEAPTWLKSGGDQHGTTRRCYLTGDLVQRQSDGSLLALGRKDTQVKINANRVDLGEIEHHLRQHWKNRSWAVAVQKVETDAIGAKLFAFVTTGPLGEICAGSPEVRFSEVASSGPMFQEASAFLRTVLPSFMVPAVFMPVSHLPLMSSSRKLARRDLITLGESLTREQLDILRGALAGTSNEPGPDHKKSSDVQAHLAKIWADVLQYDGAIESSSSFIELGGDSIAAMRLSVAAARSGLSISVMNILRSPILKDMALETKLATEAQAGDIPPYSLAGGLEQLQAQGLISQWAAMAGKPESDIQDVFPAISDRPYMMMQSMAEPQMFLSSLVFELPGDVDVERFRAAWKRTLDHADILRARYMPWEGKGFACVVFREDFVLAEHDGSLEALIAERKKLGFGPGQSLCEYAICKPRGGGSGGSDDGKARFVWTTHHAVWDAWFVKLVVDTVDQYYHGKEPAPFVPFQRFVKTIVDADREANAKVWLSKLSGGAAAPDFPSMIGPSGPKMPVASRVDRRAVAIPRDLRSDTMTTTVVRAALGLTVAHMSSPAAAAAADVLMIEGWSGRDVVAGAAGTADRILGPTMLPGGTRIRFGPSDAVGALLRRAQRDGLELGAHMSVDLGAVQAALRPFPRVGLNINHASSLGWSSGGGLLGFAAEVEHGVAHTGIPLSVECVVGPERIEGFTTHSDPELVPAERLAEFGRLFERYMVELGDPRNRELSIGELRDRLE